MNRQRSLDGGYSSSAYDKYVQEQQGNKKSVANRMQQQYWVTKQSVMKKLGRKEDEHVVAGDAELDAKLEVFKCIQSTCMEMLRIIEQYQDNICGLSQEEGAMGRFLKQYSTIDKTRAGKMMAAVGKAQTSSSEQRLALRPALARLYQEIETFRYRAISDTLMTINQMEAARLEYRAALLWMKDISKELDPDTYKQLEKFRKVQTQVRTTKAKFEKLKNDVCQKVDLLGASRCNLFSHTLAAYQNNLLHFWEKTSRTMAAVQEGFRGYQHYEFNMLKELSETSRQLAEMTGAKDIVPNWEENDNVVESRETNHSETNGDSSDLEGLDFGDHEEQLIDLTQTSKQLAEETNPKKAASRTEAEEAQEVREDSGVTDQEAVRQRLISLGEDADLQNMNLEVNSRNNGVGRGHAPSDEEGRLLGEETSPSDRERTAFMNLVGGQTEEGAESSEFGAYISADLLSSNPDDLKDDMELLNEILNTPSGLSSELATPLDDGSQESFGMMGNAPGSGDQSMGGYMPSDLLEITSRMNNMQTGSPATAPQGAPTHAPPQYDDLFADRGRRAAGGQGSSAASSSTASKTDSSKPQAFKKGQKADMSAWFNLFADLDPLANPDDIGRETGSGEVDDRNC